MPFGVPGGHGPNLPAQFAVQPPQPTASNLTLEVRESGTLIATRTWFPTAGRRTVIVLTAAEAAAVTNWANVEFWLYGNGIAAIRVERLRVTMPGVSATPVTPATMSGAGSLTLGLTAIRVVTPATMAGAGTLTPTLTAIRALSATMAGAGSLAVGLTRRLTLAIGTLLGAGSLAATLTRRRPVAPGTMAGAGSVSLTLLARRALAATISAAGSL